MLSSTVGKNRFQTVAELQVIFRRVWDSYGILTRGGMGNEKKENFKKSLFYTSICFHSRSVGWCFATSGILDAGVPVVWLCHKATFKKILRVVLLCMVFHGCWNVRCSDLLMFGICRFCWSLIRLRGLKFFFYFFFSSLNGCSLGLLILILIPLCVVSLGVFSWRLVGLARLMCGALFECVAE